MNIVLREKESVRLGSGSGDMKIITPEAIERGVKTMIRFNELAKSKDAKILAVATSAVREAQNRDEFLCRVKEATGIDIEVVSGAEEARLIYIGAIHALPILHKKSFIIDIGGGSTETITGLNSEILYVHSAKLGAIRLTKKFELDKNPTKSSINKCRDYIKGEWAPILKRIANTGFECVIGTSGTIMSLAAMAMVADKGNIPEVFNGVSVSAVQILKIIKKIVDSKSIGNRAKIPGMDPNRADIILGGALILEESINTLGIQRILISSYALREGIVYDYYQKEKAVQEFHHLSHLRYHTIYNLACEYKVNLEHAEHVKQTALKLFDELQPLHKLGYAERELLEAAGILHDVGYHISQDQHHKHSFYIISNCIMPGFTNDEAEVIANIARYHRKSHPKKKHENFAKLTKQKQDIVALLAAFLRIGEGIDRRQIQNVKDITVKVDNKTISIGVIPINSETGAEIEIWGANRRKPLLEEILNMAVMVQSELA